MKMRWIGLCFLMMLMVPSFAWAQEAMTPTQMAQKIQDFYRATTDFQAKFTQTYTDVAAGDKKVSYGRVYFKKPGKMRWDYHKSKDSTKRDKIYVSDGNAFWIYETEFQQVFKQCLSESQLPTSLRFLSGEGELLKDFDVAFSKTSTAANPKLMLTPKEPTSRYKAIEFLVNKDTFQVLKTTIFDPYGNTNEIVFDAALVNRKLPDSGFEFKTPKGAREINGQKTCK
ncbi:MAG: outer membrane lipoprotein carrier protein LolA [bacterium]